LVSDQQRQDKWGDMHTQRHRASDYGERGLVFKMCLHIHAQKKIPPIAGFFKDIRCTKQALPLNNQLFRSVIAFLIKHHYKIHTIGITGNIQFSLINF